MNEVEWYVSYLKTLTCFLFKLRSKILCNILIEIGIPTKLIRIVKKCWTESCSNIHAVRMPDTLRISYSEWYETRDVLW